MCVMAELDACGCEIPSALHVHVFAFVDAACTFGLPAAWATTIGHFGSCVHTWTCT